MVVPRGCGLRVPRARTAPARPPRSGCCWAWCSRPGAVTSCSACPCPPGQRGCCPGSGSLVEGPAFYPQLSGRANLARIDAADRTADPGTARRRIDAALERVGLLAAAEEALPGLLARHEAAAGHRRGPAPAARADHPGRAHQRPGPAGHPGGARADPGDRHRRHHRARLLAPAGRGRADLHPRRRHAHRPAGVPGHAGRAARPGADPGPGAHDRARTRAAEILAKLGLADIRSGADGEVSAQLGRPGAGTHLPGTGATPDVPVAGLDTPRPSLEELFVGLTGEGFDVDG